MIVAVCFGAACGTLMGALQPVLLGLGSFNAVPILTGEYTLVGASMGFALANYVRFRRRLLKRVREASRQDN
ncbi:hypothetical protein IV102_16760 [bacterium]|nr:hypothetical protein [bacterium]